MAAPYAPDGSRESEPDDPDDSEPTVAALRASSDRTVFTEDGNSDGWIATDTTVELRQ
jgi:hypothetical protein